MATAAPKYPFDPTGRAPTNRIVGEQIVIIAPGDRLFHFTMPKFAPMFEEGAVLRMRALDNSVRTLIKGVDFYFGHKFADASLATMHPIYGSIVFLKRDIVGTLIIDYNTVGDIWTIDIQMITEILLNTSQNPRITTWEQVVDRPIDFPIIDHPWDLDDMVGQKEILVTLQDIYEALLQSLDPSGGGGGSSLLNQHIANKSNPHGTTAFQVGAYSKAEIDSLLNAYLKTNAQAADSAKLGGKTLAQLMADVKATKVDKASLADRATQADNADNAADSARLGGKSLLQIMQDVAAATVANATKFAGKTYSEAKADILTGKAADSARFEGKTLNEVIAMITLSSGDAATLNGKNLTQIMADVKTTKVDNATRADTAGDASSLGGKTLAQILADVAAVIPKKALDSDKVYGRTFDELVEAILTSDAYNNFVAYESQLYYTDDSPVQNPANTTSQDPAYIYVLLGEFTVPTLENTSGTFYNPNAKRVSTVLDLEVFLAGRTVALSAALTILASQAVTAKIYSDHDLGTDIYIGLRTYDSVYKSTDGTKTGKATQAWMKVKKTAAIKRFGMGQYNHNSFDPVLASVPNVWSSGYAVLDQVTWAGRDSSTEALALSKSVSDLSVDTQAALDALADSINTYITVPLA